MTDMLLLNLEAAARTDVGVVRRGLAQPDEDTVLDARFRETRDPMGVRALFAVADGQSHTRGGKVASAQCVNMLEEGIEHYARRGESSIPGVQGVESFLRYVIERIDYTLRQSSENNVTVQGMGTTLTAVVVDGNAARILHAGDSRAYLLRSSDRGLRLLTRDEVAESDGRLVPTNGLGCVADSVRPNVTAEPLGDGDVLLVCTDGLYREIDDALIRRILCGSPTAAAAADRLIRAANHAGGHGNIGVVVVHVGRTAFSNDAELDRMFPLAGAIPPGRAVDTSAVPMPIPGSRARTATEAPVTSAGRVAPGEGGDAVTAATRVSADPGALSAGAGPGGGQEPSRVDPWATPAGGPSVPASPPHGGDPRRIVPPLHPPGAVHTSPFMAALAGLAAGLVIMGAVWFIASRGGRHDRESVVAPVELQPVPVNLFFKPEPFYPADVAYRRVSESGEQEWKELTSNQYTDIPMIDPDFNAELFLRVRPKYNSKKGGVLPTMFSVKVGRTSSSPAPAAEADTTRAARRGSIEVLQRSAAQVVLRRAGSRESTSLPAVFEESRRLFVRRFDDLALGDYEVTNGISNETKKVSLTAQEPSRHVEFKDDGT